MSKNMKVPTVKVGHVLGYFWKAIREDKWSFYFSIFAFSANVVLHLVIPLFYKKFFDFLAAGGDKSLLVPKLINLIVLVLGINAVIWILYRAGTFVMNNFQNRVMARLRQISFDYILKHSHSFFANNFSGALVQRVGRFNRAYERLYGTLVFNMLPLFINVIFVVFVVYFQEPLISYILIIWVIIISIFSYFFSTWKLKYDIESAKADSATTALLSDVISNQNTVASFTGFNHESRSFKKVSGDQARIQTFIWNVGSITDAVQSGLLILVEFFIFYYAIKYWQRDIITVGTFILLQVYILSLSDKLWNFNRIIREIYQGFADSKEMVEILETPYEIKDLPKAKVLKVKEGKISFENTTFGFNKTRTVIKELNLSIEGGQKVALVGPSGAGKSTVVRLLLRMYDLDSGLISIDGQDIKKVTQESLRKNISLVPQDPILFHRTLMENIRYGRLDATDKEVIEAAKLAHCDEFIDTLPLKYETYVGERGIKLSGGERQRVAIARAILKNAPILILDEATSSLDSHSEAMIQDALDKLMKGKTSIVIAHRLSTIRKMDKVIVIDGGKIIEQGSHEELINSDGSLYKMLWNLQAGGFLQS